MSSTAIGTTGVRNVDEDYDDDTILQRERARLKASGGAEEEEEEDGDFEGGGDEDGDGDEDEEDEDEEDEEERGRPKKRSKKHRKARVSQFIDFEAEVSEDDGDEDEDEELLGDARDFIDENEVKESDAALRALRDHQRLDRRQQELSDSEAAEIADQIRDRYRQSATRYTGDLDQVPQRLLMPDVKDPSLWQVRVRPGRERDIVFSLIRKARDLEYTNHPLEIMSAFERSSLPGMIYVEARSAAHVRAATNGLVGVFISNPINLVPIEEMSSLLRIKKKEINIEPGSWVRIRRGRYQGDLAQVVHVFDNGERYAVKYIPRIDVSPQDDDRSLGGNKTAGKKRTRNALINTVQGRPPQRAFNAEEIAKVYGVRSINRTQKRSFTFQGDEYAHGYCIKDYKPSQLAIEDVQPTLEEITKFSALGAGEDGAANKMDLNVIREAAQRMATSVLQPGDNVEVFEGQQTGVYGVLQSISGDNVLIKPSLKDMDEVIEVVAKSVRKRFQTGEHVKVMSGKNVDETGLVLTVNGNNVTFLSDTNQQEITVFAKDLRTAAEVGTSNNMVGNYGLHDFVSLDQTTVGVIFATGRDSFRVLDQYGNVHTVQPHQIAMRRESKKTIGLDHERQQFKAGDNMVEVEGAGRSGVVLHIYSFSAFLHNRTIKENGGVFVTQCHNISRPDALRRGAGTRGPNGFNPHAPNPNGMSVSGPVPENKGNFRLIGALVTIVLGGYKGYDGTIKDVNGTTYRVEIQSTRKVITIGQDSLRRKINGMLKKLDEPVEDRDWRNGAGFSSNRNGGWGGSGGQTPSGGRFGSGGKTPGWGASSGRTPNPYADGGKTPAWSSSSKTPNPYASADGGKTPAWVSSSKTPNPYATDGGKTPAWNTSSRTPNPYASGTSGGDAWNSSARTPNPYAQDGGRTPATGGSGRGGWGGGESGAASSGWGGSASNADSFGGTSPSYTPSGGAGGWSGSRETDAGGWGSTPAVTAPTPGGGVSTPAPISAPTPGVYGGAPTPAPYSAATPLYGAPTPAPYGAYGAPTPGPMSVPYGGTGTPAWGAPTPGPGTAPADDRKEYLLGAKDVVVKVVPKYTEHGPEPWNGDVPEGSTGRIISTLATDVGFTSTASLMILTSTHASVIGSERPIPLEYLEPVRPDEGGRAYVLTGEYKGRVVRVRSIDQDDAFIETGPGQADQIPTRSVAKVYEGP
ncbi:transcription elongation factor Spt5 [Calocera viscosa TUFC12733]|uniref:Transcription elongation factor SPT5 n=1 Tax=Calocera viscosa (strain TUFC12733) TaxID=1330018 RepID=A0A167PY98_CALVF|nr:transcription elongation factor Spt5 [Calocera viscosa TUFC12733]